jgi:putative FmdB family regulatory protein
LAGARGDVCRAGRWERSLPIYEYQCVSCGAVTDIKHGFKETTNESCPTCGGALKRLFNPAGIVFKGSGFYVTDSRKASESKSESKGDESKPEPPAPKSDSGSKSDSGGKGDAAA